MEVQLVLIPFGVFWIVLGLLMQQKGFIEWNIRFRNSLQGIKTEITKTSITGGRIGGVILIIFGAALVLAGLII